MHWRGKTVTKLNGSHSSANPISVSLWPQEAMCLLIYPTSCSCCQLKFQQSSVTSGIIGIWCPFRAFIILTLACQLAIFVVFMSPHNLVFKRGLYFQIILSVYPTTTNFIRCFIGLGKSLAMMNSRLTGRVPRRVQSFGPYSQRPVFLRRSSFALS